MMSRKHQHWIAGVFFALLIAIAVGFSLPAYSYLPDLTAVSQQNPLVTSSQPGYACSIVYGQNCNVWDFNAFPVSWNLNSSKGSNITGTTTVHDVIQAGFATWMAAPNTSLANTITEGAPSIISDASTAPPGVNLICFVCNGNDQSIFSDASTLAITLSTAATAPGLSDQHGGTSGFGGQILQAMILFNPTVQFVTSGTPTGSQNDLATIATHEIGHFLGLDHSGVVAAVMFPFAPPTETTLSYDDVAAISLLYPTASGQTYPTGQITGKVTLSSSPVFGAHVFAESTSASQLFQLPSIRKSAISALTRPDGQYTITGLPADSYIVLAEPLDGPVDNTNIEGYATTYGQANGVQTAFTTAWH